MLTYVMVVPYYSSQRERRAVGRGAHLPAGVRVPQAAHGGRRGAAAPEARAPGRPARARGSARACASARARAAANAVRRRAGRRWLALIALGERERGSCQRYLLGPRRPPYRGARASRPDASRS